MKIIIIEDEKPAARRLSRMLNDLGYPAGVMLHSVKESVDWLNNHENPDLILLDIQLSDGLSFEIFDQVQVQSAIIFTTAYDEYALKAFKLNSIDYLLKPIDKDELRTAIEKFQERIVNKKPVMFDLQSLKAMLQAESEKVYKKRFIVKIGQHIKVINVDEICCVFSENKGTYIRTDSQRDYPVEGSLEQIADQLDPLKFFRINRKYLVNISFIEDIIAYSNNRLKLKISGFNEEDLIVSRDRARLFKEWLE